MQLSQRLTLDLCLTIVRPMKPSPSYLSIHVRRDDLSMPQKIRDGARGVAFLWAGVGIIKTTL
jgi:hypothetical protein